MLAWKRIDGLEGDVVVARGSGLGALVKLNSTDTLNIHDVVNLDVLSRTSGCCRKGDNRGFIMAMLESWCVAHLIYVEVFGF